MYCEAVSRVSSSVLLIGEDYTCCQVLSIGEPLLLTVDLRRATLRGMKVPFYQWLQGKLKELNMSQADVIRNAEGGIKSSQMSRVYNGKGKYDAKTIRTIAKGMKLPQAELFYRAGLTDEDPAKPTPSDPVKADIWNMLERMTDEQVVAAKVIMEQVFGSGGIDVKTRGSKKDRRADGANGQ